jgi:ElaB/YqjD/DUF883 family membrane-anchored ribosome-binding protein
MTALNDSSLPTRAASLADGADHLASQVDASLQEAQNLASHAVNKLSAGVDHLRDKSASTLLHAAAQAEELAHRGLYRTREAAGAARDRAVALREVAAERVQADPMKAVLVAAAAGAATALLVQWLRQPRRHD